MKTQRLVCVVIVILGIYCAAQSPDVTRDSQAISILARTTAALGRVPNDGTVTGTVETVLGSTQESGTFRLLMRGASETLEEVQTNGRHSVFAIGDGIQKHKRGNRVENLSWEFALSSQPATLPFAELQTALIDQKYSVWYLGGDTINGVPAVHLRFQNTFAKSPKLQSLSELTQRDLWIDTSSGLPLKISSNQLAAGGSSPRLLIELYFADYRNVSGVVYPFFVLKSVNGVPQSTFKTNNVTFDTGLSDSDFDIQ